MVAQMDEHSMYEVVVCDPDRSRGLVGCRIQKTNRYDYERQKAQGKKYKGPMPYIWDFVVVRDDGTQVFLHPKYANKKIACFTGAPALYLPLDLVNPRPICSQQCGFCNLNVKGCRLCTLRVPTGRCHGCWITPMYDGWDNTKQMFSTLRFKTGQGGKGQANGKGTGASPSTA